MIPLDSQQAQSCENGDGASYLSLMYAKGLSKGFLADVHITGANETGVGAPGDLVCQVGRQTVRNLVRLAYLATAIAG